LRERLGVAGELAGGLCERSGIRHVSSVSWPPARRAPPVAAAALVMVPGSGPG
jgi:hypothetical protein